MNKSEELENKANHEENDIKAFGIHKKAFREKRDENFKDKWLPLLKDKFNLVVFDEVSNKYTIDTETEQYGIIDYFPKKNSVLIRKENRWIKQMGLKFIVKYILVYEQAR